MPARPRRCTRSSLIDADRPRRRPRAHHPDRTKTPPPGEAQVRWLGVVHGHVPTSLKSVLLADALLALALAPAAALAHPGHHHAGLPGVTSPSHGARAGDGPERRRLQLPERRVRQELPAHTDSAGGRKHGDFFYITTERDLTIYDVTTPAAPRRSAPHPARARASRCSPRRTRTRTGRSCSSNAGVLMVIDVSDKTAPEVLATLDDADDSTRSPACSTARGPTARRATIIDLRDPAEPRLADRLDDRRHRVRARRDRGPARASCHLDPAAQAARRAHRPGAPDGDRARPARSRAASRTPTCGPGRRTTSCWSAARPSARLQRGRERRVLDLGRPRWRENGTTSRSTSSASSQAWSSRAARRTRPSACTGSPAPELRERRPGRHRLVRARHALPEGRRRRHRSPRSAASWAAAGRPRAPTGSTSASSTSPTTSAASTSCVHRRHRHPARRRHDDARRVRRPPRTPRPRGRRRLSRRRSPRCPPRARRAPTRPGSARRA